MLSVRLVRTIEDHAEPLTQGVITQLQTDARLPHLSRVPRPELEAAVLDLYANLGRWLGAGSARPPIEETYRTMGWHRHAEGVPLSEAVYSLILTKNWLRDYIRRVGVPDTALDLAAEEELYLLLSSFFDQAIVHLIRGYEREEDFQRRLAAERAADERLSV